MSQSIDTSSQYTLAWSSTISSSSTVSNLPGPSRTVGHVFSVLGASLELALSSRDKNKPGDHIVSGDENDRSSSFSDDTQSNIPGPSRSVDYIAGVLGVALERRLNMYADKLGFGPDASLRRITSAGHGQDPRKQMQRRVKECKKLLKYIYSSAPQTQLAAIRHIITISVSDVLLRQSLIESGAYQALHTLSPLLSSRMRRLTRDADYDALLTSSRQALCCIEENAVNNLAKEIFFSPPRTLMMSQFVAELDSFAKVAMDNALMYLAVRYITSERGWRNVLILSPNLRKQVVQGIFELFLGFPVKVEDDGSIINERNGERVSY